MKRCSFRRLPTSADKLDSLFPETRSSLRFVKAPMPTAYGPGPFCGISYLHTILTYMELFSRYHYLLCVSMALTRILAVISYRHQRVVMKSYQEGAMYLGASWTAGSWTGSGS